MHLSGSSPAMGDVESVGYFSFVVVDGFADQCVAAGVSGLVRYAPAVSASKCYQ